MIYHHGEGGEEEERERKNGTGKKNTNRQGFTAREKSKFNDRMKIVRHELGSHNNRTLNSFPPQTKVSRTL